MSAVLAHEQIDTVIADLELLKDIRRAITDLRDTEIRGDERVAFTFSVKEGLRDQPVCFVHGGSQWLAAVALQAMEREVKSRLASKAIEVEAAEVAA